MGLLRALSKNGCTISSVYKESLNQLFLGKKPLFKMIKTDHGYHLYDTGTNKILSCNIKIYELLQNLQQNDASGAIENFISKYGDKVFLETAKDMFTAIKSENIMKLIKIKDFHLADHFKDFKQMLKTTVQSISLELVQNCNIQCLYCVYNEHVFGKRNNSSREMTEEIAYQSLEFLKTHSVESDYVSIGFYGGEPLIKFPLIKKCVKKAGMIFENQQIEFNCTTNATLITSEIADFLMRNDFSVIVSLDGPQEYHDMYRKTKNDLGTYDATMKGLKLLVKKHKKIKKGKIAINMVYAPPYSEEKIERITKYIADLDILSDMNVMIGYPTEGTLPPKIIEKTCQKEDKNLLNWAFEKYRLNYSRSSFMIKGLVEKQLTRLIQRPIISEPVESSFLNGCCLPGQRKNFIDTDGAIHVCEKISTFTPIIGNVKTGFDFKAIQKTYINDYAAESIIECETCWGVRLCDLCYLSAIDKNGEFNFDIKKQNCQLKKNSIEYLLCQFAILLEDSPEKIDYLYKFELT